MLTDEQIAIVDHEGSAFVSACPGAGKTFCILERARKVLLRSQTHRGIAFLSFSNSAISELQKRLARDGILRYPEFPHFVGTFDSFIWHFLVQPFGLEGCNYPLRIIPDTGELIIKPFQGAQELKLHCFDRHTGKINREKADKVGFRRNPSGYETVARNLRIKLLKNGHLDFSDVRRIANQNLEDEVFSNRLGCVLGARFEEIIVDEAQDCNPQDLSIISWLRITANISTKVVCDPNQSIYGFRGGVSNELFKYALTFAESDRLSLTGNFRSSRHICRVVHMLRAPSQRGDVDIARGKFEDCNLKIQILSYRGRGVSNQIGSAFASCINESSIDLDNCKLTAKTHSSGSKAIGSFAGTFGQSLSLRLASAVMKFQYAGSAKDKLEAITETHSIIMKISERLQGRTYHQVVSEDNLETLSWRGHVVKILQSLRFEKTEGHTRHEWILRARSALNVFLPAGAGGIAQQLRNESKLDEILAKASTTEVQVRSVHEVKGKQYQGICIVLTSATAKGILTHLESEPDESMAEEARVLYVAASRAQKLLVFACPKSQSARLARHISSSGAMVQVREI